MIENLSLLQHVIRLQRVLLRYGSSIELNYFYLAAVEQNEQHLAFQT